MVDAGLSFKQIKERLNKINIDLNEINVILLTHEHSDHVKGIKVLQKNSNLQLYATNETFKGIKDLKNTNLNSIKGGETYFFDEIEVEVLKTSHDSNNSVAFLMNINKNKILHATDMGYVTNEIFEKTKNIEHYIIESNYEDDVLMVNTKYPFSVKKRILSDVGHLSNIQCNDYLNDVIGNKTQSVIFAHLSENNNNKELVELINKDICVENKVILSKNEIVKVELSCK